MNLQDALLPWSAPCIFRYLEANVENTSEVMSLANRFPEVAARVILCPIFSHRSFEQLSHSPALSTFLSMSGHALEQLKRYQVVIEKGGVALAPSDEVSFASTVTSTFLKNSIIDLGAALTSLITENSNLNSTDSFLTIVSRRLEESMHCASHVENENFNNPQTTEAAPSRRTLSLLLRKETAHRKSALPQRHYIPSAMASTTNVALGVRARERSELLKRLGDTPLPFQVRSIEDVEKQFAQQKKLEANTTVILTERVSTIPPWKRSRFEKQTSEYLEDEGMEKVSEAPTDLTATQKVSCEEPSAQPDLPSNATWVTEGELVLVNGRLVHRVVPKGKELKARRPKSMTKVGNGAPGPSSVEEDIGFFSPPPPSPAASTPVAEKRIPKKRKSLQKEGVSTEPKRRNKKGTTSTCDPSSPTTPTSRVGVVDTQSAPLKSRDELVTLVEGLQIPDTLRQAFLIGLTADVSTTERGGHP